MHLYGIRIGLPFKGKFDGILLAEAVFSLLTARPAAADEEEELEEAEVEMAEGAVVAAMVLASVQIDCGGVDMVGVFGGDSSLTCRADFSLSITALSDPLRFLFAWLLPDDLIES